jgi:carnosine synthase
MQMTHVKSRELKEFVDILESFEFVSSRPRIISEGLKIVRDHEGSSWFTDLDTLDFSDADKIPGEILEETSIDAQRLRQSLLRNSCIIFLTAGYESKKFIYKLAHKHGVRCVIIDQPDSWCRSLVEEGIIEHFIPIDISQSADKILQESLSVIESLPIKPNGVCTFVELFVNITSRLAKELGLPHMPSELVDIARDKSLTRSVLGACGLPHVKNRVINSPQDLHQAGEHVGFPCVLKPVSGAASICVQKIDRPEDLPLIFSRLQDEMIQDVVITSGALERRKITHPSPTVTSVDDNGVLNTTGPGRPSLLNHSLMLEEYLDGPEVDVDMIMSGGKCRYANVIDNGPTFEPYFAETWAVLPSLLEEKKVQELRELAIASVTEMGFTDGIFHVELRYTSRGPRLIEVNARMGGGPTRMIHKIVSGIDLVIEQFLIALGIPSRPIVPSAPLKYVGYAFINTRKTGVVKDVEFMRKYKDRNPHLVWVLPYIEPYQVCIGPEDGHPTWLGDIVVAHESGEAALAIAMQIESEIAHEFQQNSFL